jgi:hypothetical protein
MGKSKANVLNIVEVRGIILATRLCLLIIPYCLE